MGASILTVNNISAAFKDSDLLLVLRMAANTMREQDLLPDVLEAWDESRGPGVIELPLQQVVGQPDTCEQVLSVLLSVESAVQEFGGGVPYTYLEEECEIPDLTFTGPCPTQPLLLVLHRLRALLAPGR
jgi:hypothetical protein